MFWRAKGSQTSSKSPNECRYVPGYAEGQSLQKRAHNGSKTLDLLVR